jgi:hypothetical protein
MKLKQYLYAIFLYTFKSSFSIAVFYAIYIELQFFIFQNQPADLDLLIVSSLMCFAVVAICHSIAMSSFMILRKVSGKKNLVKESLLVPITSALMTNLWLGINAIGLGSWSPYITNFIFSLFAIWVSRKIYLGTMKKMELVSSQSGDSH